MEEQLLQIKPQIELREIKGGLFLYIDGIGCSGMLTEDQGNFIMSWITQWWPEVLGGLGYSDL